MSSGWIIQIAALIKPCPITTIVQISGLTNEVMFTKFSGLSCLVMG